MIISAEMYPFYMIRFQGTFGRNAEMYRKR